MRQKTAVSRHRRFSVTLDDDPFTGPVDMAALTAMVAAITHDSLQRYAALAESMAARGKVATAAAFRALYQQEVRALDASREWAQAMGHPFQDDAATAQTLPPDFDRIWSEFSGSALITPYRAFAAAVQNRQRIAALLSYMAAEAVDHTVRIEAEKLAAEALSQATGLRRWRRLAWHRDRQQTPPSSPRPLSNLAQLDELLDVQWRSIAAHHQAIAHRLRELGETPAADFLDGLSLPAGQSHPVPSAQAVAGLVPAPRSSAGDPAQAASPAGATAPGPATQLPPETRQAIAAATAPLPLIVLAQRPIEQLVEELDRAVTARQDAVFDAGIRAMEDAIMVLADIARFPHGSGMAQARQTP